MKKIQSLLLFLSLGFVIFMSSCAPAPPKGTIVLSKTEFAPNEEIKITFTVEGNIGSNAWIGVIPSSTPHGDESKNDEFDIAYQYFEKSGELTFTAPAAAGDYDFRMNSSDSEGIEICFTSFKVIAPVYEGTLTTDKTEYSVGEKIVITFTAPVSLNENAWIGLIPSETPHGSEATNDAADVEYAYIKKQASGTMTFTAPEKTGSWDIRMNDSDSDGKEITSITIKVK